MHARTIFNIVFLCLWWTIVPTLLFLFIRARKKPAIARRAWFCTVLTALYSSFWVTNCIIQDILLTEGHGYPCVLAMVMSLFHLPFFTVAAYLKGVQIILAFRPEKRTKSNIRIYTYRGIAMLIGSTLLLVCIIAVILLFTYPERFIDPLRDYTSYGISALIGGRECSQFQDWYIYLGTNIVVVFMSRHINVGLANVNDFWDIGLETRIAARIVVAFHIPFHLLNLLAWYNVFDRISFESDVCPIAYIWVAYHAVIIVNIFFYPLTHKNTSLADVVSNQVLPYDGSPAHAYATDAWGLGTEGGDGTGPTRAKRLKLRDSTHISTSKSPASGSYNLALLPSRRGGSHLKHLLTHPDLLAMFETHARRALCVELTFFWRQVRDTIRSRPKWDAWLNAIEEERVIRPTPQTKQRTLPTGGSNEDNDTNANNTNVAATNNVTQAQPQQQQSQVSTYPKPQYFDSDAEAYYCLRQFDLCFEQYIRHGSLYELNIHSRLYDTLSSLHLELTRSPFWSAVQSTFDIVSDSMLPSPSINQTTTAATTSAATTPIEAEDQPLAIESSNTETTPKTTNGTPTQTTTTTTAMLTEMTTIQPFARLASTTVTMNSPTISNRPLAPPVPAHRLSARRDSHSDVGGGSVPTTPSQGPISSATPSLPASLVPVYPLSSPGDLAIRFLRAFIGLETEILTLMSSNLYESFIASHEFKQFQDAYQKQQEQTQQQANKKR